MVIAYGLSNVADCEKVLQEMCRLVRPGGYIYCLDSYQPEEETVRSICETYRKIVVPTVGAVLAGKGAEYKRLAKVESKFLTKKELVKLLQKCGFVKVGYLRHLGGATACHRAQKPVDTMYKSC